MEEDERSTGGLPRGPARDEQVNPERAEAIASRLAGEEAEAGSSAPAPWANLPAPPAPVYGAPPPPPRPAELAPPPHRPDLDRPARRTGWRRWLRGLRRR
ncbi:conserved hypothetical protein [Frankia sp. AgKG'84/4]